MQEYAAQRGLRRTMIAVPVLTPRLSSLWLWLVTPVYAGVGRKLVDSLRTRRWSRTIVRSTLFAVRPRGIHDAIARALAFEDRAIARDAMVGRGVRGDRPPSAECGGLAPRRHRVRPRVALPPARAFAPIQAIGGATGWYKGAALWRLRGLLDVLVGGPGLRRGRRDPVRLEVGDTVDFWRVEAFEPDRLLRLHAEMRVPGRAWLQFEVYAGATVAARSSPDGDLRSGRVSSASSTGTGCGRSTATSSAACCATSSPLRVTFGPDLDGSKPAQARHRHVTPLALACMHGGGTQSDRAA